MKWEYLSAVEGILSPASSKFPCLALLFSNNAFMCKLIMWTEGKWRVWKKKKKEEKKQNELGQLRSLSFIFAGGF